VPGLPPQRLSLYNFDVGMWELIDLRTAANADAKVSVTISSDAPRFIEPGTNGMLMRIEMADPGDVFFPLWKCRVDQAVWFMTP
jgi:hypothetical protein